MEKTTVNITLEQKKWLINNSITPMASRWEHEGRTQSEHFRAALDIYIKELEQKEIKR